ncbi:hypothetical protein Tco_0145100 [Tanacetum coccineum]
MLISCSPPPAMLMETQAAKFVRDFKSLAKEADESLAKHKALELEIEHLLRAVVSQDIISIVQNPSVVVTSNSVPSSRESTVVNNERVIAPGIFRINPFKANRYVNGMKSRKKNQSANVSKSANQKKHKAQVWKPKNIGSLIVIESMVELESIFGHLFDELSNGENQVVSKSSDVTTTDAFDKRQQQQDSTSSTSTLATAITADGNFDLDPVSDAMHNLLLSNSESLKRFCFISHGESTLFLRLSHSEIVDIEKVAVRSCLRLPNNKKVEGDFSKLSILSIEGGDTRCKAGKIQRYRFRYLSSQGTNQGPNDQISDFVKVYQVKDQIQDHKHANGIFKRNSNNTGLQGLKDVTRDPQLKDHPLGAIVRRAYVVKGCVILNYPCTCIGKRSFGKFS